MMGFGIIGTQELMKKFSCLSEIGFFFSRVPEFQITSQ